MTKSRDFNFRKAKKEDASELLELCKEHAAYEKAFYNEQNKLSRLEKILIIPEALLNFWVVEVGESLIGYASFMKQFSSWKLEHYLYLDCLYLKNEYRGRQIGRHLMEAIKQYAKAENLLWMEWQTPSFNKRAINFYEKMGAISYRKERFIWVL